MGTPSYTVFFRFLKNASWTVFSSIRDGRRITLEQRTTRIIAKAKAVREAYPTNTVQLESTLWTMFSRP